MTAPVYLPGDRATYRPEPVAPGQPVTIICGHPSGRLYIHIAGVGDLLVAPAQLTPREPDASPPPDPGATP
jgi:hypothetical protein